MKHLVTRLRFTTDTTMSRQYWAEVQISACDMNSEHSYKDAATAQQSIDESLRMKSPSVSAFFDMAKERTLYSDTVETMLNAYEARRISSSYLFSDGAEPITSFSYWVIIDTWEYEISLATLERNSGVLEELFEDVASSFKRQPESD